MVTNNVTVYQFEVGLDEVFADEVRFRVNVDCVIVVVVKDCLFFVSFILCENSEGAKDAACTCSLCSIRSGSTNFIDFPCPLESGPSSRSKLCPWDYHMS